MKTIRNICLLLSVIMIGAGAGMAFDVYMGYKKGRDEYADLRKEMVLSDDPPAPAGTRQPETTEDAVPPVTSETPASSPSGPDPWADPVDPVPAAETVPSPEETPASDPLFNTFGL